MNREAYWYIFLRTSENYENVIAGQDEYYYGKLSDKPFFETFYPFDSVRENWSNGQLNNTVQPAGKQFAILNTENPFSPDYTYPIPPSLKGSRNVYIVFETKYLEPKTNSALSGLFTVDIADTSGKTVFYKTFRMKRLPDTKTETWREGSIGFKLPEISSDFKQIKLYIWNPGNQTFYVDNMALHFYTYQD
jgi:hypothetical protein